MTLLIIYLLVAIGVSFLCSILEAVLLSVTQSYIETLSATRPKGGRLINKVKGNLDESLSSVLILNTFAHTMGAAGVGAQAAHLFGAKWETFISVLLTLAILYLSEIIPKTIGATYWRQLAIPSAYIITWLIKLVYPLVWFSTRITRLFSKGKKDKISREEIIALASLGHKMGTLVSQENDYLNNVLNLRNIKTEKIITPRVMVHSLEESLTVEQALDDDKTQYFSRIPVYKKNKDNITGVITKTELYIADREECSAEVISQYIKPIQRVSEKLPVQQLLDLFIKKREHLFLVEDEYGQPTGIVTLEDAIETMLGREIVDETDTIDDLQYYAKERYRRLLKKDKEAGQ